MAAVWRLEYDERSSQLISWEHPAAGQPIQRKATPVDGNELTALTARWRSEYRTAGCDLESIGAKLWQFLAAHAPVGEMRKAGNTVRLLIDAEGVLAEWPWEILHDGSGFTLLSDSAAIEPVRWLPGSAPNLDPANRPLRVLFMAASAEGVKPVLDHEGEERAILDGARKNHAGIDLVVEDTGSIEGLGYRLAANGAREDCADVSWYDIVHVSGHADVSTDGPVFILETELGERDNVEPPRLIDTFGERWPRLTFLSGCSTARDNGTATRGMATAIVRAGAPLVLGWALPVGDAAATAAAAVIYAKLAENHAPDRAIRLARKALFNAKSKYWHLLRVVARDVPQKSFVTAASHPGRAVLRNVDADQEVEYFDSEHEESGRVCPRGRFVGRRRPLQRTTSVLRHGRALGQTDSLHRPGVVIHGLGGQGKSSLGCRLLDRFRDHLRVILVGHVDEPTLIRKLGEKVQAIAPPPLANGRAVMDVLQDGSLPLKFRLTQILSHPPTARLLFVFDDFEKNVDRVGCDGVLYTYAAVGVVTACADAIRAVANSQSRVIITCWHTVPLSSAGWKFADEHLEPLSDAEQARQRALALNFSTASNDAATCDYLCFAGGNPVLITMLSNIDAVPSEASTLADLNNLFTAAEARAYIHRLFDLVREIASSDPPAARGLAALSVLSSGNPRTIVDAVLAATGHPTLIDRIVSYGLINCTRSRHDSPIRYAVPPIVRCAVKELVNLTTDELIVAKDKALDILGRVSIGRHDTDVLKDIVSLSLERGKTENAVHVGKVLLRRLVDQSHFVEAQSIDKVIPASEDEELTVTRGRLYLNHGPRELCPATFTAIKSIAESTASSSECRAYAMHVFGQWCRNNKDGHQNWHEMLQQAAGIYRSIGREEDAANILIELADAYEEIGNRAQAVALLTSTSWPSHLLIKDKVASDYIKDKLEEWKAV